ncbi:hypothetical protein PSY31_23505, partial [Shigella flexneri]|nr:hypothetical protein [Shigella flexneri]
MAAQSNGVLETNDVWYADSGANQHITTDLNQLSLQESYTGGDEVVVGNGAGLPIQHTGFMQFSTSSSPLSLTKVWHCP